MQTAPGYSRHLKNETLARRRNALHGTVPVSSKRWLEIPEVNGKLENHRTKVIFQPCLLDFSRHLEAGSWNWTLQDSNCWKDAPKKIWAPQDQPNLWGFSLAVPCDTHFSKIEPKTHGNLPEIGGLIHPHLQFWKCFCWILSCSKSRHLLPMTIKRRRKGVFSACFFSQTSGPKDSYSLRHCPTSLKISGRLGDGVVIPCNSPVSSHKWGYSMNLIGGVWAIYWHPSVLWGVLSHEVPQVTRVVSILSHSHSWLGWLGVLPPGFLRLGGLVQLYNQG